MSSAKDKPDPNRATIAISRGLPPVRISQWADSVLGRCFTRNLRPERRALRRVEAFEGIRTQQVVEGVVRTVDLSEPARRAGDQNDPGLVLQGVAQSPSRILVHHVPKQHVEVLDDQDEPLPDRRRELGQRGERTKFEGLVVDRGLDILPGSAEVDASDRGCLISEMVEALQPELAAGGHAVAFLRQRNRKQSPG